MDFKNFIDRSLEYKFFRVLYGFKLFLVKGPTDESLWFLLNRQALINNITIAQNGTVLDIGSYTGEFSLKLKRRYPNLRIELFEPFTKYYEISLQNLRGFQNVNGHELAVTKDGREVKFDVMGIRTKQISENGNSDKNTFTSSSISFSQLLSEHPLISLLKMNIEGMEYECIESIFSTSQIEKVELILIQFHDFSSDHSLRRSRIQEFFAQTHTPRFIYEWKWELWELKSFSSKKP